LADSLIQPPRLRAEQSGQTQQHATWLELFYDLIFAVTIAQLATKLAHHIDGPAIVAFAALFVPVWWSWIGTTFFATRFVTDNDLIHRLLLFVQMFIAAVMAVNVGDAFGTTSRGFSLSYAALRAVLVISYIRAGRNIREARPLTNRFGRGFGLAAIIWVISAFVPAPIRFVVWGIGLAVDFGTPLFAGRLHTKIAPDDTHLPERFGQFTLIVVGEAVTLAVMAIARQPLTLSAAIIAALALSMAFSLSWVYFDNLDGSAIRTARMHGRISIYQWWLYAHLPLVVGLTATGVGVEYLVSSKTADHLPHAERWLLCGAVALTMLALAVIHHTTTTPETEARDSVRAHVRFATAAVILLFGALSAHFPPLGIITFLALACALQVVSDLRQLGRIAIRDEEQ
jgi:low temperature requirement protein LtrA